MSKLKRFFNFFRKEKEKNERYLNHIHELIANKCGLRVSYKNIYGDEESCDLGDFHKDRAPRCTGDTKDILRIYINVDNVDYYVVRRYDNQIRLPNFKTIEVTKEDINDILNKIL